MIGAWTDIARTATSWRRGLALAAVPRRRLADRRRRRGAAPARPRRAAASARRPPPALAAPRRRPSAAASAPSAAEVAARASLERIRALRAQRPGDGLLVYYQAITHAAPRRARCGPGRAAQPARPAPGIVPARGTGLDSLWGDPEFQAVREQLAAEEPRTADAPVSFRLADPRLVPEGIAWDAAAQALPGRQHRPAQDRRHRPPRQDARLLPRRRQPRHRARPGGRTAAAACSTPSAPTASRTAPAPGGATRVLIYDLGRGRRIARHDVAEALQLNDVAVAADGTLYVTDSAAGSIFRMRPGERRLTPVRHPAGGARRQRHRGRARRHAST